MEPKIEAKAETKYRACDKKSNLYILQQNQTILERIVQPDSVTDCYEEKKHHPFFFKLIPSSNLMLIVINKKCGNKPSKIVSAAPEEIRYDKVFPCYKLNLNNLTRRRLEGCFTEHEYVSSALGKTKLPLLMIHYYFHVLFRKDMLSTAKHATATRPN